VSPGNILDHKQVGIYLPCYDIFRNGIEDFARSNAPGLTPYAPLVAGSVARSLACIACSPIELARTRMQVLLHLECFTYGVRPTLHNLVICLGR
jgi:solute carrier family 25 protein 39/40